MAPRGVRLVTEAARESLHTITTAGGRMNRGIIGTIIGVLIVIILVIVILQLT
jgi:hypothetical protein